MFEKRFLYIFLACSALLIGCSKSTEEKAASVDTSEPVIVAEKDASDEAANSISEDQSDDQGKEINPVASNPYFFQDIEKEYMYSVKLFFYEDIKEVPVKLSYVTSFDNGDVYSLSIQHDDCPERYYYDVLDRFDIGTFYVTNDSIYLLLQCEDVPNEEKFISEGILVCSGTDMDENIDGQQQKIQNDGDTCRFSFYNTLIESGFYSTYTWTKGKGLTSFRSGYGAEGSPIEIELANDILAEDNISVLPKDICTPKIIEAKATDDTAASEEIFDKFFEIKDIKDGDVTYMADGYENSNLKDKLAIKRVAKTEGYVEYHFLDAQKELFSVKNKIEQTGLNAEYIQYKDINSDGNDEILVSYWVRSTAIYFVLEFYVYGIVDDKWQQLMSYSDEDDEGSISKLLNSCPYKGRKVSDVSLSEDGLIIVSDNGTKIGGVYYPDGYKLLVR